jgi:hypothetical protein
LYYATVVPIYDCHDVGIRFQFVNGGNGEFAFPWEQELVVGFWAPVVAAVAQGWKLSFGRLWLRSPLGDRYWSELRPALKRTFDQAAAGQGR